MNTKKYYLIIIVFIVGILSVAASKDDGQNKTNKDLLKFSHSLHVEMTECQTCHSAAKNAETLDARMLPTMENCAECHDVEEEDNCGLCHYEEVYEPAIQKTSGLIFSHKFHLGTGEVKCADCHTGFDKIDYGFEAGKANPAMSKCMTCHSETAVATTACEACHVSTSDLYPESHRVVDFFRKHKFMAQQDDNCQMCHSESFCETCHASTTSLAVQNTADDFYTPYSPYKLTDSKNNQQLEMVHGLDYRFTHGIDAKGKESNCVTCHETETFCVECHNSTGGDFAEGGFTPTSHTVNNFIVLGVGSGGGEHATLARRDIESCAGCHDVNGADPSCILCHNDPDGIKGTNPKTHAAGFMSSADGGDWHTDFNSVCYNCHTDANANPNGTKGMGFCGYCHN